MAAILENVGHIVRVPPFSRKVTQLEDLRQIWCLYHKRWVSQMWVPLTASREPVGSYNRLPYVLYVFEHKTQYLLIHAPCARIPIFWHISNMYERFLHLPAPLYLRLQHLKPPR